MQKHTKKRQFHLYQMNLSNVILKSAKLAAILEKVNAILDFQMYIYLDLTNA